ncbi:MAG: TonB-dependent receptor, partial [Deltaproteobacteria bacterium]|nr:TonB-dependent receptor [Deltaproteobacteria bacterium]
SNIDLVFDAFVPDDAFAVVAAPVYLDYQVAAALRPATGLRTRLLAYGSRDTLRLLLSDPPDSDPLLVGRVDADLQFHRVAVTVEADPAPGLAASASLTAGTVNQSLELGPVSQSFRGPELFGRGELSAELVPAVRVTVGTDVQAQLLDGRYRGPAPGVTEGNPQSGAPLTAQRFLSLRDDAMDVVRGGTYLELGVRPIPTLRLVPGLRVDHLADLGRTVVDPRLTARWEVGSSTTLKGGVGRYSQAPEWWQALPAIGSDALRVPYAIHASLGAEQRVTEGVQLAVEGFAKRLDDLVAARAGGPPHLDNAGEGRVVGAELLAQAAWAPGGRGQLAYTLSRSERRDASGGYRPFDRDQPHVLSAVGSQELGRGFSVSARLRLVSGNPTTPVVGGVFDARTGAYLPRFGPTGSSRDPLFHQLDLRAEKAFRWGPVSMVAYLELLNSTAAENPEGRAYSFDYRRSAPVSGLPILPNLGLRGEL